jgi:hypothetical protein
MIVNFLFLILLCDQTASIYLPPTLQSINSQEDAESTKFQQVELSIDDISTVREENIKITEEMTERLIHPISTTQPTFSRNSSKLAMDPEIIEKLEDLVEHALRHVAVLIPNQTIKTTYQQFIDFFPPGTIGGTLTILAKEILAMLWTCIKNRTKPAVQLQN